MLAAAELAGFFAAHAIWYISDGELLVPMLATQSSSGERGVDRLAGGDLAGCVAEGERRLKSNDQQAAIAVLIYDGFITLPTGRTDALLISAVDYQPHRRTMGMAIPYRPIASAEGFAIHRPKFLDGHSTEHNDYEALGDAFFRGVDRHEHGARIWTQHLDQSR